MVTKLFWKNLWCPVCYEPLDFDEKIALECGLTPFTYKGINLLGQGEYAKNLPQKLKAYQANLSPRLDAYEFLMRGTICHYCDFFSEYKKVREYFEYVVGKEIVAKMKKALNKPRL